MFDVFILFVVVVVVVVVVVIVVEQLCNVNQQNTHFSKCFNSVLGVFYMFRK
jgi:threonine/homoserine/homoserine lactone efflux protein